MDLPPFKKLFHRVDVFYRQGRLATLVKYFFVLNAHYAVEGCGIQR